MSIFLKPTSKNTIQELNLKNVASLSQAQSRSWTTLGQLQDNMMGSSVQFYENKLFVVGHTDERNSHLQVFDLSLRQTTMYSNVYSVDLNGWVFYLFSCTQTISNNI